MFRARAGRRPPHAVEIAFRLSFLVVLIDAGGWLLETFFLPPTGFQELRERSGWAGAVQQAAVSAGVLVVLGTGMLLCAFRMRQGRNWARLALIALGALYLAFLLTDMNMDGLGLAAVHRYLPELCTAAIAALLLLPASRAYFSAARRTG
ncbi:hypothetical protein ACIQU1_29405 [Streptomyces angustmyceticus]|uniref:hypothetical protein n=1 Tax=Streptomyces angustmyceticus TaxID=285578 RepID=UPI00344BE149